LKETRFEWVPGVAGEFCCGVLDDQDVRPLKRVGTFIWERPLLGDSSDSEDGEEVNAKDIELEREDGTPNDTPDGSGCEGKGDLVGLYFHGGG
jgi:hypothetical protein